MKESGEKVLPRARMNGPLISFPLTAQIGTLPEKIGCCILALPADPSVGFLGPLGMDGILGGAVTTGTGAGAGAAAGAADSVAATSAAAGASTATSAP